MSSNINEQIDALRYIIFSCKNIEEREGDPFTINVIEGIERLRRILPKLNNLGDFATDGEAFYRLIVILSLQEKVLKNKASSLYSDPNLIGLKLLSVDNESLADAFLKGWRPVASSECMNYEMLRLSFMYWNNLKHIILTGGIGETNSVELGRLKELGLEESVDLTSSLLNEYNKLKGINREVSYEEFIEASSLDDKLRRAIILSYLITFGYVHVRLEPLKSKIWIMAKENPSIPERHEKSSLVYRVLGFG